MTTATGIRKDVSIIPDIKTVGDFYQLAKQGQIQVMPEWLQRLRQPKKWRSKNGAKTKSFLQSFFKGNSLLTPFYVIQSEVLKFHILESIRLSDNDITRKIYQDISVKLEEFESRGVLYILLDGQNRLFEALEPFFEGTLINNDYDEPFEINGKELNKFKFTDLDKETQKYFYNTQIVVAEGIQGSVDAFINSVIDLNDGVPWTKFEGAIIKPSALSYEINKCSFDHPPIQALFGNDSLSGNVAGMSGNYEIAKKGDSRFMAELVYMLNYGCNNGAGKEDNLCDILVESDGRSIDNFSRVKNYLLFISSSLNCIAPSNSNLEEKQKPMTKECLRNLVILLDIISNPLNTMNHSVLFKVRSIKDIKLDKLFCEEFIKWHRARVDSKVYPQDFTGKEANPDTYAYNNDGHSKVNLIERMKFINYEYIKENYEKWVSQNYVSESTVNYKSWENYLKVESDYTDPYSKADPVIDLRSKVHIDHIKPRKLGGSDKPENLTVTREKPNLLKGSIY